MFFWNVTQVGNLIPGTAFFPKNRLVQLGVRVAIQVRLQTFIDYMQKNFAGMWNKSDCVMIFTLAGILSFRESKKNRLLSLFWQGSCFPNLTAQLMSIDEEQ